MIFLHTVRWWRGVPRSLAVTLLLLVTMLVAGCVGDEESPGARAARQETPRVIENATPVQLGRPGDPAAIAATAAAQVAAASAPAPAPIKAPAPAAPPPPTTVTKVEPVPESKPGIRLGIVQPTWESLRLREQELGAQVRLVNSGDPEEYERNITQLIRGGANVIITIGVDLSQVTQDVAEKNPSVKFIGIDQYQERVLPNVVGLVYHDDRAGFLAGALAGLMTKTDRVAAIVGPGWMTTMLGLAEGFAAGAEYVNPNVQAWVEYHPGEVPDGMTDQTWGTTIAQELIADGADVIFAAGGRTGQGAIEVAQARNVLAIGAIVDQYDTLPAARGVLLTSVLKVLSTQTVGQIVEGLTSGTVSGGNVFGDVAFAPFREADPKIPRAVHDRLRTIEHGLAQGSIKTGILLH